MPKIQTTPRNNLGLENIERPRTTKNLEGIYVLGAGDACIKLQLVAQLDPDGACAFTRPDFSSDTSGNYESGRTVCHYSFSRGARLASLSVTDLTSRAKVLSARFRGRLFSSEASTPKSGAMQPRRAESRSLRGDRPGFP